MIGMLSRVSRFQARTQLAVFDGVGQAIAVAFGGKDGDASRARDSMTEAAYPGVRSSVRFAENLFAEG